METKGGDGRLNKAPKEKSGRMWKFQPLHKAFQDLASEINLPTALGPRLSLLARSGPPMPVPPLAHQPMDL